MLKKQIFPCILRTHLELKQQTFSGQTPATATRKWGAYTCIHYRLRLCNCQIRIENSLKMQVIRTVLSTRIPNSQTPLVTDNALNRSVTHLPVYQLIQLIYQRESKYIIAYQRSSALKSIAASSTDIGRIKDV